MFFGIRPMRPTPVLGLALLAVAAYARPVVTDLYPAEAWPGDLVFLQGTGLDQVTAVRLGQYGALAALHAGESGTILSGLVPAGDLPLGGVTTPLLLDFQEPGAAGAGESMKTGQTLRLLPGPQAGAEAAGASTAPAGSPAQAPTAAPPAGPALETKIQRVPDLTDGDEKQTGLPVLDTREEPRVSRLDPDWGHPGSAITLIGTGLDGVETVSLGALPVVLDPDAPRTARRLTFRIQGPHSALDPAIPVEAPVILTTARSKGRPFHRVLAGTLTVLPREGDWGSLGPAAPRICDGRMFQLLGQVAFLFNGLNLSGVQSARIGDRPCSQVEASHRSLTFCYQPAEGEQVPPDVRVTLTYQGGSFQAPSAREQVLTAVGGFGRLTGPMQVDTRPAAGAEAKEAPAGAHTQDPPAVTWILPAQAGPGERVLLFGRGLDRAKGVTVGDLGQGERFESRERGTIATFTLPAGWRPRAGTLATLRLDLGGGRELAAGHRLLLLERAGVAPRTGFADPADLHLACLYLTQAVQSRDGQVPLVQGRTAVLRVFPMAAQAGRPWPRMRVTVRDAGGRVLLRETLDRRPGEVPTRLDENDPLAGRNLRIAGDLVQAGMTVEARILDKGREGRPGSVLTVAPQVVAVPPVRLTLVPVRLGGRVGQVEAVGRTLGSWLRTFCKLLPVGTVTIGVGEVWDPGRGETFAGGILERLAGQLEDRRTQEDPWSLDYHCAIVPDHAAEGETVGSTSPRPLARSLAVLDHQDGHLTLAHELGHVLGLDHAPAGKAKGTDPDFPDPDGYLECAGFDLDTMAPVDPRRFFDLMGYGPEDRQWVSAYSWCRALAHLTREQTLTGSQAAATESKTAATESK
jgi:hypothetical protein